MLYPVELRVLVGLILVLFGPLSNGGRARDLPDLSVCPLGLTLASNHRFASACCGSWPGPAWLSGLAPLGSGFLWVLAWPRLALARLALAPLGCRS